jgi:hypothetical protein
MKKLFIALLAALLLAFAAGDCRAGTGAERAGKRGFVGRPDV